MRGKNIEKEEMNCKERLYATFEQKPVDRVPCPGILQTGIVDLMDACGAAWPEAHWDAEKMAKLAWAAHEIAGLEGVRVPMNVYVESEALGAQLFKWKKDNAPMIKDYKEFAVKSIEDIDKIETPDPRRDGKLMPATVKAVEILAPKCKKEKIPITVQPIAAVPLATNVGMVDMMKSFIWVKTNPEDLRRFIQKTKEIHVAFTEVLVDAGADVVLYNLANVPEIGVEGYMKIDGFKYDKECVERDKKLGVHVVTHSCSSKTRDFLNIFCDLGLEAISIAEMIPMKETRQIVGDRAALIGNVNQLTTLLKGTPEQVIEEARKCIEDGTDVLCPGCGFGPRTPLANMKALVEAAKKYGGMGRLAKK